jgi:PadR family transcriptional regulator, regulatory protein PadR
MYLAMATNGHADRWGAQLRKGSLDLAILAVLWNERLYGLEILWRLESASLELAEGTLYPILMRLKQDGLLKSTWVETEAGHPRKYYWLTRAGRERVLSMAESWRAFSQSISELLLPMKNEGTGVERS